MKLWRKTTEAGKGWTVVAGPSADPLVLLAAFLDNHNTDAKYDHRGVQYRLLPAEEDPN
jgi:hypothetical protein